MIFEVVNCSIPQLLNAELTASWEKGLTSVANGDISKDEYLLKLNDFVVRRTNIVKQSNVQTGMLYQGFNNIRQFY